jgi:hypothetical protein
METWKVLKSVIGSLVTLLLLPWALGTITSIQAQSSGQTLNINNAKGFGNLTSDTTTSGRIVGAGILNGNTKATFMDRKLSGGGLFGVDAAILSYVATVVIESKRGALTMQDVGIFDTAKGKFSSVSNVTKGTGRFEGATGFLFFHGEVFSDGSFIDEISGEIQLP